MKTAILFGASGFVGSCLLDQLLQSAEYSKVIIVVRKPMAIQHPKLHTILGSLDSLDAIKDEIHGHHLFIAIGTTRKKTPDENEYYKIDHDYPVLAAKIAKANGAQLVSVVSAVGANAQSNLFYIRTKGETEQDIAALNFEVTQIFRPSMIMGNRLEKRFMERFFILLFSWINPILGKSKYRGITANAIAQAMMNAALQPKTGISIYHWYQMQKLQNAVH